MNRKLIIALLAAGVALVVAALVISSFGAQDTVQTAWLDDPPTGPVLFCSGEDVSTSQRRAETDYNRRRGPGSVLTFVRSTFTADKQHDLYLRSLEKGSDECDVIALDVIYMAKFAARDLLYDMTPYLMAYDRRADFDDRAMKTVEYDGKLWGVPSQLDVGVMYYRSDLARKPTSWQDVYRQSKRGDDPGDLPGLRLQRGQYEGLTVVFLELAYSAGATPIVSDDGKTANLDQPEMREALTFMRNAIRDEVIPDRVQTDEGNLDVYERGRARFLRGWPFVAARIRDDAKKGAAQRTAAANTKIIPLPPWQPGGQSVSILGGHNLVIPRSAPNPSAALHLIEFMTSASQVLKGENEDSQFPVLKALADDPDLSNRPLLNAIKATNVIPRPAITQYADVSTIISRGVTAILSDEEPPIQEKLSEMQRDAQSALDGDSP